MGLQRRIKRLSKKEQELLKKIADAQAKNAELKLGKH